MRLYHPNLKPPHNEYVTASDDELHVKVYLDAGWIPASEPEVVPGLVPEPVTYAPVTKTKRAAKTEPKEADK